MPTYTTPHAPTGFSFPWQALYGSNDRWRVLATLVITIAASFIANLPLVVVLANSAPIRQRGLDIQSFTPEALGVDPTLFLALLLLPFVFGLVALWYCVKLIHQRDPRTLVTGVAGRFRWRRAWLSFGVWMLLTITSEGFCFWLNPDGYALVFSFWAFAKTLIVVILMIPLQIAFEELMMRGYILQQTTLITKLPWVGLLVSTLIFAALHYQNPEVQLFGLLATAPYYLGVGLFLGLLTIFDDGLELALGIHLATNVFGSVLVNFKGSAIPTPSIIQASEINLPIMTALFVLQAFVFFLLFRSRNASGSESKMKWTLSSLSSKPLTNE